MFGIGAICSCQQVYAETTKRNLITLHAKSWSVYKIEVIVKVWWGSGSLLGNPSLFFAEDVLSECPSRFKLWCWIYRINGVGSPVLISSFCFLVIFLCSLKHTLCFICSFISFKALFLWAYSSVKVFIVSIVSDVVHCVISCAFQKAVLCVFSILCLRLPGVCKAWTPPFKAQMTNASRVEMDWLASKYK